MKTPTNLIKEIEVLKEQLFKEFQEGKKQVEIDKALADWRRCGRAIEQLRAIGKKDKTENTIEK